MINSLASHRHRYFALSTASFFSLFFWQIFFFVSIFSLRSQLAERQTNPQLALLSVLSALTWMSSRSLHRNLSQSIAAAPLRVSRLSLPRLHLPAAVCLSPGSARSAALAIDSHSLARSHFVCASPCACRSSPNRPAARRPPRFRRRPFVSPSPSPSRRDVGRSRRGRADDGHGIRPSTEHTRTEKTCE